MTLLTGRKGLAGTSSRSPRFAAMAEQRQEYILTMQALAARFRAYAAETSLETFRNKFEATAEELERLASLTKRSNARGLGSPGTGSGRGYEH